MLSIEAGVDYDDVITGVEFHSHQPYASATFNNSDEIRIPISQQDIITAPFESTLHISGTLKGLKTGGAEVNVALANNAVAFLFEDIRYEICGVEIDRTKNLGITSLLKNLLSVRPEEENNLKNACWHGPGKKADYKTFTFSVPLRLLLGFAEDYKRVIVNTRQELILLRSASDANAVITSDDATSFELTVTKLYWRVPHITVSDQHKLKLYKMVESDTLVHVPFRSWELHEYPMLPSTNIQSWSIKTSSQLEKPRYVVLAFQTDRKNKMKKNMSQFDACNLTEVKLYLNSQYYPYDNIRGDQCIFYEMFANFQKSYYGKPNSPVVDFENYKSKTPIYVIDCSKQNDSIKSGPVDVRLEFQASENFPANTSAYCLIIHDTHMSYTLLTGTVKKMM